MQKVHTSGVDGLSSGATDQEEKCKKSIHQEWTACHSMHSQGPVWTDVWPNPHGDVIMGIRPHKLKNVWIRGGDKSTRVDWRVA